MLSTQNWLKFRHLYSDIMAPPRLIEQKNRNIQDDTDVLYQDNVNSIILVFLFSNLNFTSMPSFLNLSR